MLINTQDISAWFFAENPSRFDNRLDSDSDKPPCPRKTDDSLHEQ